VVTIEMLEAADGRGAERWQRQTRRNAEEALRLIRSFGIDVVPFDLPDFAVETIDFLRYVETAAAFYDITMTGQLTETEEGPEQSGRPNQIRASHFTPAVEYIRGNRQRMRIMQKMDEAMADLDLFLGSDGRLTNRLGHPQVSLPSGFHEGTPTALHLTGKLFGEPELLLPAHAIQAETQHSGDLYGRTSSICLRPSPRTRILSAVLSPSTPMSDATEGPKAALEGRYSIEPEIGNFEAIR